jgi:hypothetical protein
MENSDKVHNLWGFKGCRRTLASACAELLSDSANPLLCRPREYKTLRRYMDYALYSVTSAKPSTNRCQTWKYARQE